MNEVEEQLPELPTALNVVVWFFYILAAIAIYDAVVGLMDGSLDLNIHLLLLPCANGLATFSNRWRIASIVIVMLDLFLYGIGGWFAIAATESIGFLGYLEIAAYFAIPIAIYSVLVTDRVEVLFKYEH